MANVQISLFVFWCWVVPLVTGHGRLIEPPSRASAWRYGFNTPHNYNDNQLFCGGFTRQYGINNGRCGVCGDPWDGPRAHEAGGKYATGTIVRSYRPDELIPVKVEITANHKGWIEFRLCPNNNPDVAVTHECLNNNVLTIAGHTGTKYPIAGDTHMVNLDLQIPSGLSCTQCVLQWKYNAGNSWGTDPVTKQSCVGCGPQEQFYGCSDIAIKGENPTVPTGIKPSVKPPTRCWATNALADDPLINQWCAVHCSSDQNGCNSVLCTCSEETTSSTTTTASTLSQAATTASTLSQAATTASTFSQAATTASTLSQAATTASTLSQAATTASTFSQAATSAGSTTTRPWPLDGTFVTPDPDLDCGPVGLWKMIPGMVSWCRVNCQMGQCTNDMCSCVL